MTQTPKADEFLLKWRGDTLKVTLRTDPKRYGRAALRTNLGHASIRRREIIAQTERDELPMARAWTDLPLEEIEPGLYQGEFTLNEVGVFSAKPCFFPEGSSVPEWPEGGNFHIKVESELTRKNNSIYTVFPRQFGSFREVVRRLPLIMDQMGFRLIQTLPPFPVPTTYAVMGEYGCPFASLDFLSVDPAMAEFDEYATPLDQFRELIDAVHSRRGLFLVDLPANHTGWASTLQTHHPEWFHREADGHFVSPGAWGVKWADLVELDYSNAELRAYMADVFLFWCRNGVDGFRCDAGYMIPAETWEYIVARVREEYPDTVFMLEGLGGDLKITDRLLAESNLDWAYSEIFQTYNRDQFEWYLPGAIARSEKFGTLVHFAETHDNDRLAKGGKVYAKLRVQLAALLSWQGAWGIANGVEWFCTEKIDVHGKNDLNWGAQDNLVDLIGKLNFILEHNENFAGASHLELITRGGGNTLAVKRAREILVLANLDCSHPTEIDFDRKAYPYREAFDLVTERKISLSGPVTLQPGEVLCLTAAGARADRQPIQSVNRSIGQSVNSIEQSNNRKIEKFFHWIYPRDLKREVVVPENEKVEIAAPCHFRLALIDPATGRTIRTARSSYDDFSGGGFAGDGRLRHTAVITAPHYKGDGTAARRLVLKLVVYTPMKAQRTESAFLVPPTAKPAAVKTRLEGGEVRKNPLWRTILSNGSGAAAQLRLGWGLVNSQYDAILAANPDANCPSDRVNLWTRTRCWLQREGYTRELDAKCMTAVEIDPAGRFARWSFSVPCGMGRNAAFTFDVALAEGFNAARIKVTRVNAGEADVGDQVRLVFRPDIEWRSFHSATKAYGELEHLFPAAAKSIGDGFVFRPYAGEFMLTVDGGAYHHEPQWSYNVPHGEEAERGQEGAGDLFSPGWISADLKVGAAVSLLGEAKGVGRARGKDEKLVFPEVEPLQPKLPLAEALRKSLELFIVKRDDLKTVIAGYPWFLDWGRDTFIFMRGMIAAGMYDDSLKILQAFAAFEENGTLPNIIYGKTAGNRDTTDAQLWFVRCVGELARAMDPMMETDDPRREIFADLRAVSGSIVEHYITGTPNGIHMDADSALVWSPSHFTWMDTNYPACTPRIGYPVEIQALWISALTYVGRGLLAERARASLEQYFKVAPGTPGFPNGGYRDCLAAPNGERAADAYPEDTVRPNQLFLITLGILDDRSILDATEELLVPGGIRSLNSEHNLYCGSYTGDEDTRRKPAYHNGTVWGWPFALYAEALASTGSAGTDAALSLLASAVENLNRGSIAHMSEIADADAPHAQKGCCAQAWSVSEVLRVWKKLAKL